MSQRNIIECDRCHREISEVSVVIEHKGEKKDLCEHCRSKLDQFMSGQELEVLRFLHNVIT